MKTLTLSLGCLAAVVAATPVDRYRHANILSRAEQVKDSYDYVIVGGGTAGLTLADRLTEDKKTTVLVIEFGRAINEQEMIEAGNRDYFPNVSLRFNITSIPQAGMNGRTQEVVIGAILGGSSAINGMVVYRGTKEDYDAWKTLGGPGSTWDWNGVFPYFKKAFHFNPPNPEVAAQFNITYDPNNWIVQNPNSKLEASYASGFLSGLIPYYNAMKKMAGVPVPKDGFGGKHGLFWNPHSMDDRNYWRSYSRTAHYDGIKRPNYEVILLHKVNKVLFNGKSTVASGVEYISREDPTNKKYTVKAKKEVILSAGTVHTPQILQRSGIGPSKLLKQANIETLVDLPGVGQNFQDHPYTIVAWQWGNNGTGPQGPSIPQIGDPATAYGPSLGAWLSLPVTSPQNYQSLASRYASQSPSAFLPSDTDPTVLAGYSDFKKVHEKLLRSPDSTFLWYPLNPSSSFHLPVGQHVVSVGSININPSNPDAEPIVDYRALSNPIDVDLMVEYIQFYRRFLKSPDFAPYSPTAVNPPDSLEGEGLKTWVRDNYVASTYHPVGTAGKKPREKGGVVDEELRVHGVKKLRVVDASVIPLIPAANTQSTVYMIAEKAADMIKKS